MNPLFWKLSFLIKHLFFLFFSFSFSPGGGVTHIRAIKEVAYELYGVPLEVDIKDYCHSNFSGTTDSWIAKVIIETATNKPATDEQLEQFHQKEDQNYHSNYSGDHIPLIGVVECIKKLSEMENVSIGLCTGNYPRIGWTKVTQAGVADFFKDKIGGFGDIMERDDILAYAIKDAEKKTGHKFDRIIHIGDAVTDVRAALNNNAIAVAVCTGGLKTKDQFPKPCFVLENLEKGFDDLLSIIKSGRPIHKECINE